ncbi:Sec-independent protein secretion pathway component TatC [Halovivax ruber XH-70]|uniref:Sec-independent protein translocase protein TatC n=1 Tax=Halovivax ruber (strain DSM 18193 / JCM 13892 / XH-70) TaxID=797302 RepID=L0ID04_HALRX|nr:twin-arginine translocase subunit TatC [Halovivax ruber]AGB17430.1 Sec-independent protein secretion pathway component TatC [Halovivax ruber XH-70]
MSGVVDEDTAQAINTGRATAGAMVSTARRHLQKVFIFFVIGFIGTFYAMRIWVWDFLEQTAKTNMEGDVAVATELITRTPFEVILLQAKIGLLVGIVFAIPALVYYARGSLQDRGFTSVVPISRLWLVAFGLVSIVLFVVGIVYAFTVFFPFTFLFLGEIAYNAGVKPSWGITEFTEFVSLLTISFGLAAQLPLLMATFSYTEIVSYETFRDKWRHAIVGITVFGAFFSPPDPITQLMWALPLVALYVFSLGLAKLVANTRRRGAAEIGSGVGHVKRRLGQTIAIVAVVFLAIAVALAAGARTWVAETIVPELPPAVQPAEPTIIGELVVEHGTAGLLGAAAILTLGVAALALAVVTVQVLRTPVYPRESALATAQTEDDVDFTVLDPSDIKRVPAPVFSSMSEDEMMSVAREAMHADDREKAQAIIDRFDSIAAIEEGETAAEASPGEAETQPSEGAPADGSEGEDDSSPLASTAAGMLDPFTESETTEEDLGGFAYDLAFIVESLTSKLIYVVGLFMAVLAGSFLWLYAGGIKRSLRQFVDSVPRELLVEVAESNGATIDESAGLTQLLQDSGFVVALHPVEVLIFIVKVSTILAAVSILPFVCYWAWPAIRERGLARGDRRTFAVWGVSLFLGFAAGTYLGFFYIAPSVISYLITDALANEMVVSYRMKSFFWLVIYTTLGVGFLFNVLVTMVLFHVGNIVSYRTMRRRWRPAVVGIFVVAMFASPSGILKMFAVAIPLSLTYLLGLAVLYVLTAGGRLFGGGGATTATESGPDPAADVAGAGE